MSQTVVIGMLRGPVRINDKVAIRKAKEHAEEVINAAKRAYAVITDKECDADPQEPLLKPMLQFEQYTSLDEAVMCVETMSKCKATDVVNDFVRLWNSCPGDMQWVDISKTQKVVAYAGVDQGGYLVGDGWAEMREATWFDLFRFFKVK